MPVLGETEEGAVYDTKRTPGTRRDGNVGERQLRPSRNLGAPRHQENWPRSRLAPTVSLEMPRRIRILLVFCLVKSSARAKSALWAQLTVIFPVPVVCK